MSTRFISANPRPEDLRESNDCTVRATSLAMNKHYFDVHKAYASVGRKPRHGVTVSTMNEALKVLTTSERVMIRALDEPTFSQFAKDNPKGRFIVVKRKHAVALIDGVWHDAHASCAGARCRVKFYYEIKG